MKCIFIIQTNQFRQNMLNIKVEDINNFWKYTILLELLLPNLETCSLSTTTISYIFKFRAFHYRIWRVGGERLFPGNPVVSISPRCRWYEFIRPATVRKYPSEIHGSGHTVDTLCSESPVYIAGLERLPTPHWRAACGGVRTKHRALIGWRRLPLDPRAAWPWLALGSSGSYWVYSRARTMYGYKHRE